MCRILALQENYTKTFEYLDTRGINAEECTLNQIFDKGMHYLSNTKEPHAARNGFLSE